ncbi:Receptor-like serine/threonine-protein kinase SD1-7 [Camellia lanceoleosa]|uniref:Receptor-like serine/threonine-protein kinase SD1-7 n=1 Tax=Camellia lanceoleosa TaxID=1840588 RepID=A0ACC0GEJ4_9ERIC|nr:Receptor-like serine/threonine-protein kinase SD1-7 [Camellia lanceoleosa]
MRRLASEAGKEPMMYAHEELPATAGDVAPKNVSAMVQCCEDISGDDCNFCLQNLTVHAETCCLEKSEWRILAPSCNMRYEEYLFLTPSAPPPVPPPAPTTTSKGKVVLIITVPVSTFLVVAFGFYFYRLFGRRSKAREVLQGMSQEILLNNLESQTRKRFMVNGLEVQDEDAWRLWNDGKAQELIDRNLIGSCPVRKVAIWINIALLCVQENPDDRPSMSKVAFMLGGQSTEISKPSEPPFSVGRYPMSDQWSSTGEGTEPASVPLTLPRE